MTKEELNQLGKTLWDIADRLRGAMNAAMVKRFSTQRVEKLDEVSV